MIATISGPGDVANSWGFAAGITAAGIIGALITIPILGLFICWRFARALKVDPPPSYQVKFDVDDPLSPEPFVDAQPTIDPDDRSAA